MIFANSDFVVGTHFSDVLLSDKDQHTYSQKIYYCKSFRINTFKVILMFGTNSICYQRPKAGYET